MKLDNKFFSIVLAAFAVQMIWGINLANAKPCEAEIKSFCSLSNSRDANWCYESERTHVEMNAQINSNLRWIDKEGAEEGINHAQRIIEIEKSDKYTNPARLAEKYMYSCFIKTSVCMYKNGGRTQDSNTFTDYKGCDGGSQSSSSGSSSQSNSRANQQSANNQSSSTTSVSPNQTNQQASSSSNDSVNGLNMKPEQAAIINEASQTYKTKTAAFEESHKGLRHKHNKEDEASRCLIMDGRQITNTCDFRVEYIFCAYNPDQKAFKAAFEMAAAFDCEKRQMGMQGAAPRKKQAGTFTTEAVYIFGCKDPSLPSGVTYERGRGLSGRCE